MTMHDATERQLRALLPGIAPVGAADRAFEEAMAGIAAASQRPAWLVRSTGGLGAGARGFATPTPLGLAPRLLVVVVLLALLVIAAGLLGGGGRFGPIETSVVSPTPGLRSPAPARTSSHTAPPVLPGEPWILYERFTQLGGGLFLMRPDGTDSHRILGDIPGVHKDADWSPDGDRVVFIDEQTEFMWVVGIDGSTAHRIAYCDDHQGCAHPAWSPDGNRIAFSRVENADGIVGPAAVGLYVIDLSTNIVTPVVRLERPLLADVPRWSPDGTELVFGVDQMDDATAETGAAIAVVPVTGGEPRYLTPFDQFAYVPDWNRIDGRILFSVQIREAMAAPVPNDTWDVFTLAADGTGLRQVTNVAEGTRLWFPSWTPDGSQILAADQGRRLAVLVDPQTGQVEPIGGADLARPLLRPLP